MMTIPAFFILIEIISTVFAQDIVFPTPASGSCETNSGKRGWCQEIRTCSSLFKHETPSSCGFNGKIPIVCCPISVDLFKKNTTIRVIGLNIPPSKTNLNCGERELIQHFTYFKKKRSAIPFQIQNKIQNVQKRVKRANGFSGAAGGEVSFINSWPWMVLLGSITNSVTNFFCSGSLINENYVITAAHCVLNDEPFFARLGEHDYSPDVGSNQDENIEDVGIKNIIFHPRYDINKGYYDIALLQLNRSISIRNQAKPICLPWGTLAKEDLVNEEVTVAGWGRQSFGGFLSSVLREVNVTVFHPSVCEKSYSTLNDYTKNFPDGMNRENIVCAGDINGGKDACQGDSGGPMMHYKSEEGTFSLAGIISKGFGCGIKDFPGLYSPLRDFETMAWIKDVAFQ